MIENLQPGDKFVCTDIVFEKPSETVFIKTNCGLYENLQGEIVELPDWATVDLIEDCKVVDTVRNHSRQWFNVYATRFGSPNGIERIAKSLGLLNIFLQSAKKLYHYIEIR